MFTQNLSGIVLRTFALCATLTLSVALFPQTADARTWHHGHRYWSHHHYPYPRYYVGFDSDWYWGPLAAGATLWGISELSRRRDVSRSEVSAAIPQQESPKPTQPATVYWCESEQGFYPQVRSCPIGWTALPANAVPNN